MDKIPLSYANFLILWVLQTPSHGYEIMKKISVKTKNRITVGPATMYRSLAYFLDNGYIKLVSEMDNKKKYQLTAIGQKLLDEQVDFIQLLVDITREKGK